MTSDNNQGLTISHFLICGMASTSGVVERIQCDSHHVLRTNVKIGWRAGQLDKQDTEHVEIDQRSRVESRSLRLHSNALDHQPHPRLLSSGPHDTQSESARNANWRLGYWSNAVRQTCNLRLKHASL